MLLDEALIMNKLYEGISMDDYRTDIDKYNSETVLMNSFQDPNKTTVYNYYHQYFTAKHDKYYYPEISDYIKV
jgi:hypothetical protein